MQVPGIRAHFGFSPALRSGRFAGRGTDVLFDGNLGLASQAFTFRASGTQSHRFNKHSPGVASKEVRDPGFGLPLRALKSPPVIVTRPCPA